MLKYDKLILTKEAVRQVTQQCFDRTEMRKRNRNENRMKFPSEKELFEARPNLQKDSKVEQMPVYNPEEGLALKFPILKEYLETFENLKK